MKSIFLTQINNCRWLAACLLPALLASQALVGAEIPELLTCADGTKVTTSGQWEAQRRGEVLELFRAHVFGRNPVDRPADLKFERVVPDAEMLDGKAIRKQIKASFSGPGGQHSFVFTAFIPKSSKPVPAFLLICNRGYENIDPDRVEKSSFWPVEQIVERGYAALAFRNAELDPDHHDGWTNGVHQIFQPDPKLRTSDSWGTLAAWAWGASRVMDWIESEPLINAGRVGVLGHSRGGKTALWCGAQDNRFALTISNNSGCGGAKLNRMELPKSEPIARINKNFPHWFCERFKEYSANENALPVDQHMLIALLAPRLAYVASATGDDWAGQPGEFQSCVLAAPAWGLYGLKGLGTTAFPAPDTPIHSGYIGYHLRSGKHNLTEYDWKCYMDFADKHWR
ncbi:MAG: acetylxylan esterase [Kiritimatiellae bacterium]|nr:acetylxylan esterase [Kiritimatiellia bacterium]